MLAFAVGVFAPVSLDVINVPLLCSTPEMAALSRVLIVVLCEVLNLLG